MERSYNITLKIIDILCFILYKKNMKIDLHCHTKKTKQGDDETRNVTVSKFVETLSRNEREVS